MTEFTYKWLLQRVFMNTSSQHSQWQQAYLSHVNSTNTKVQNNTGQKSKEAL